MTDRTDAGARAAAVSPVGARAPVLLPVGDGPLPPSVTPDLGHRLQGQQQVETRDHRLHEDTDVTSSPSADFLFSGHVALLTLRRHMTNMMAKIKQFINSLNADKC